MSEGRVTPPAMPQASQIPGYQASHDQRAFETFDGIDTKAPRPAIQEKTMAWCSGFMPVGPSQLAILPDIGSSIFSSAPGSGAGGPGGQTIVWFQFGNIGDTYYAFILISDGSMWACNTSTGGAQEIMAPGTIQAPRTQMGFSQWGSQYVLFAKDQTNGYWIWDGTILYSAGTIGPIITVDNAGQNYTSPPTVTLQTTGGGGGATFNAQLEPGTGVVDQITVTNPGSGFGPNDFAILNISGGGSDTTATANAVINAGGGITEIQMTNGGQAYGAGAIAVAVAQTGDTGNGAVLAPQIQGGVIVGITIVNAGLDYQVAPNIVISDSGNPGGHGAAAFSTIALRGIGNINITNAGTGYTSVPTVTIIGDGEGATANATLAANGSIASIKIDNTGSGYSKALVQITGGNNAASATPIIMPFGWSGTSVEVYQSRVWISNGAAQATWPPKSRLIWSAPENPCDPGNGGGALLGTDSFLRVGWHWLKQTNGFLYLGGDSSVNNIAGVNTTTVGGSGTVGQPGYTPGVLTTQFQNQNTDPQIGSPWPSSVQLFNRNILFANTQGIHVSYGGAVQKVSGPLDGVYFAGPIYGIAADFPSAVAQIFGIQVYMLLLPILDPTTGQITTELIMFDFKKFWTSTQGVALTYIATQEVNSTMTAWGTDGQRLFPLFKNPSTAFTKTVQSKLWANPGYDFTKTALRLWGIVTDFSFDDPLEVAIDNETNANSFVVPVSGAPNTTDVFGPYPTGQIGKLIGFSVSTTASSGNLLSLMLRQQDFELNN